MNFRQKLKGAVTGDQPLIQQPSVIPMIDDFKGKVKGTEAAGRLSEAPIRSRIKKAMGLDDTTREPMFPRIRKMIKGDAAGRLDDMFGSDFTTQSAENLGDLFGDERDTHSPRLGGGDAMFGSDL